MAKSDRIYKHVDANGNVTYSDQKTPANAVGQVVTTYTSASERREAYEKNRDQLSKQDEMDDLERQQNARAAREKCQANLADSRQGRIDELTQRRELANNEYWDAKWARDAGRTDLERLIADNNSLRQIGDTVQDTVGVVADVGAGAAELVGWTVGIKVKLGLVALGLANSALRPEGIVNSGGAVSTYSSGVSATTNVLENAGSLSATGKALSTVQGRLGLTSDVLQFWNDPSVIPKGLALGNADQLRQASSFIDQYDRSVFEAFGASKEELKSSIDALAQRQEALDAAEAKLAAASDELKKAKEDQADDRAGYSRAAKTECAIYAN